MRERIISDMWRSAQSYTSESNPYARKVWFTKMAYHKLKTFERQIHEACVAGANDNADESNCDVS